jgi:ankyrin repeat protein
MKKKLLGLITATALGITAIHSNSTQPLDSLSPETSRLIDDIIDQITPSIVEYAAENCQEKVQELARNSCININAQNEQGDSALHCAVLHNNIEMATCLLHCGAHVDIQNNYGDTPLIVAAQQGFINMIAVLLKHNANPYIQNKYGKNATDYAQDRQIQTLLASSCLP